MLLLLLLMVNMFIAGSCLLNNIVHGSHFFFKDGLGQDDPNSIFAGFLCCCVLNPDQEYWSRPCIPVDVRVVLLAQVLLLWSRQQCPVKRSC